MMWGYGFGTPGAGMTAWMIISSVLWLVIVGVAVWALVRWLNTRGPVASHPSTSGTAGPSAQEILRQRYACGEIDEATFERMQARLMASSTDQPREEATANGRRSG
jgi:putative membrane protein